MFVLINIQITEACDICGCSIANGSSSILPQFQKNFIGIRGSYARYNSHHIDDQQNINRETSISTELWGRFYLRKRLQLIAALPYNIKSQVEKGTKTEIKGIGDATLGINYTLVNINKDSLKWKHLLLAGAGIKLPTGKSNIHTGNDETNIALQPGSGSFDYLFNVLYTVRRRKLGISNDVQYRLNYENPDKYQFGDKLSLASRIFYWKNITRSCSVLPYTGVLLENMGKDYQNGYAQDATGGHIYCITMGCEVYYKSLLLAFNYSHPFNQNLSDGNVKSFPRLQFNTSFLF